MADWILIISMNGELYSNMFQKESVIAQAIDSYIWSH